ncbi:MAG: response regulator [Lachnospiraceae bacterium]|nr:response regulator [Lachnospiraceae bacterium]
MDKEKRLLDIYSQIIKKYAAMYLLHKTERTYETLQVDDVFASLTDETGSFIMLYSQLFSLNKMNMSKSKGKYEIFNNENLFLQDSYHGNLMLKIDNVEREYEYRIVSVSEQDSVLLLVEDDISVRWNHFERLKMDTIQENYLFSMIVNLKDNTCTNSNTTEISSSRQDYLNMDYLQWRNKISNMFLPDDRLMFLSMSDPEYIMERLEKEQQYKFEIQMVNMQGKYIWCRLMFTRMKGFSKDYPVFVYTVQDIHEDMTRLLQQENIIAAVEEKNKKLDSINKAKSLFISNMSHEIRTPINAVLGMDEMIIRETDDDVIRSYAYDIRNAGKMLLSIINDILDYSKIEAGKMEIINVSYQIGTVISDINNMISIKAKEKNLKFNIVVNDKIPGVLWGDEVRIKQIMINLLTNAVKYTERGEVTLRVDYRPLEDRTIGLMVRVEDTGIGMKQEDMKNLFSEFARLDVQRNRKVEGTGLGMSIVVRLLEQMNSRLEVESVYGQGSVFSFVLPQEVVDKTPLCEQAKDLRNHEKEEQQTSLYIPNARILAVDDNRVNLVVIKGLLKRTGAKVKCVQSGQECLEILQQEDFDIVLLDHLMPGMDGIETLSRIKQLGKKYNDLPVIALTANVMSGARERYVNMGFHDFIEKPISVPKLEQMLNWYLPPSVIGEQK